MARRALIGLLLVACIAGHVYSADWGLNGTMEVTDAALFPLTNSIPEGTFVKVSKPFLDQNVWGVSYFRPSQTGPERFRLDVWNIVVGEKPANNISVAFAQADRIGSMVEWAYTAADTGGITYSNTIVAGGEGANTVPTTNVANLVVYIGAASGISIDQTSFPDLPGGQPRSRGVVGTDTTAPVIIDSSAYANASTYIFGGVLNGNYTNQMLKMFTPVGLSVPTGWVESTPEASSPVPEPRGDMAAVEIRGKWYMFGGRNETHVFGDLWTFDFAALTWTLVSDFGAVAIENADDPAATDIDGQALPKLPPARYGHAMTRIGGENPFSSATEYIIMAGGTNSHSYFNDWWVLEPISLRWEHFKLPDTKFAPRAWLGLFAHYNEPYVFVWGGNDSSTVYNDLWTINMTFPIPTGPGFRALPNNIIAGVAGGILLVLIITVVVLKITDRNRN